MESPAAPAIVAAPWVVLALVSYLGTLTLGILSLAGKPIGRAWHARLFTLTGALTVIAAVLSFFDDWVLGVLLVAALVPLGALPWLSAPVRRHTRRHALLGLSAAPFYLAAVGLSAVTAVATY